jgi:hypothetical protein
MKAPRYTPPRIQMVVPGRAGLLTEIAVARSSGRSIEPFPFGEPFGATYNPGSRPADGSGSGGGGSGVPVGVGVATGPGVGVAAGRGVGVGAGAGVGTGAPAAVVADATFDDSVMAPSELRTLIW